MNEMEEPSSRTAKPSEIKQAAQIVAGFFAGIVFWWGSVWLFSSRTGLPWGVTMFVIPLIAAALIGGIVTKKFKQLKIVSWSFLVGVLLVEFIALIFNLTL